MADYIVKDTELTGVANSIRTAGSTSSLLTFPNGFINAINNISGGGGGGGSSDFDKAIITVVNNSNWGRSFGPFGTAVYENGEVIFDYCGSFIITDNYGVKLIDDLEVSTNAGETASTQTIYIVPQKNFLLVDYVDNFASCTISGSAETVTVEAYGTTYTLVVVSGDCTITIS